MEEDGIDALRVTTSPCDMALSETSPQGDPPRTAADKEHVKITATHVYQQTPLEETTCFYVQDLKARGLLVNYERDYFLLEHLHAGHNFSCEPSGPLESDATLECPKREELPFHHHQSLIPVNLRDELLSDRHIRLLELYPQPSTQTTRNHAKDNSELCCRAYQASLDDLSTAGPPLFAALSYVCGDQTPTERIRCGTESIAIPQNVHDALLHLRFPDRSRLLWVDNLCINQGDDREKSHQVGMLHKIYAQAHVVSWLGPEEDEQDAHGISFFLPLMARFWTTEIRSPDPNPDAINEIDGSIKAFKKYFADHRSGLPELSLQALEKVYTAAYFTRVWTAQEIILGKSNVCQLGNLTISLAVIAASAMVIRYCRELSSTQPSEFFLSTVEDIFRRYVRPGLNKRWKFDGSVFQDLDLVIAMSVKHCSDAKDYVYGLASLFENPDAQPVDYALSASEVFADFIVRCLPNIDLMHIQPYLWTIASCDKCSCPLDAPSWCPDWSRVSQREHYEPYRSLVYQDADWEASGRRQMTFARQSKFTVFLKGIVISRIADCSPVLRYLLDLVSKDLVSKRYDDNRDVALIWLEQGTSIYHFLEQIGIQSGPDHQEEVLSIFHRVLMFGQEDFPYHGWLSENMSLLHDQVDHRTWIREILAPVYLARVDPELFEAAELEIDPRISQDDYESIEVCVRHALQTLVRGTRLIDTDDCQLGTGPPHTQAGDLVCVIYGSAVPHVLRPVPNNAHFILTSEDREPGSLYNGKYTLVGECHVPELMYGEGLEMGLPEQDFLLM